MEVRNTLIIYLLIGANFFHTIRPFGGSCHVALLNYKTMWLWNEMRDELVWLYWCLYVNIYGDLKFILDGKLCRQTKHTNPLIRIFKLENCAEKFRALQSVVLKLAILVIFYFYFVSVTAQSLGREIHPGPFEPHV